MNRSVWLSTKILDCCFETIDNQEALVGNVMIYLYVLLAVNDDGHVATDGCNGQVFFWCEQ